MTLVRYNPLNDFIPATFGDRLENALFTNSNFNFNVPVDIVKKENAFELQVVAPGMNKNDFTIDLDDNDLVITGERERPEGEFTQTESNYGKFKRTFTLSRRVDKENIQARYENGILYVNVPLLDESKFKTIIKVK